VQDASQQRSTRRRRSALAQQQETVALYVKGAVVEVSGTVWGQSRELTYPCVNVRALLHVRVWR
jgi:hypothetical protein